MPEDINTLLDLDPPPPRVGESPQQEREAAFAAAPFHWKSIVLAPFAVAREADWRMHCRRIGLPPMAEAIGSASLFGPAALRLIWFCAHDPRMWLSEWIAYDARISAAILDLRMREWIDAHFDSGEDGEAVKLALRIIDRARLNSAVASPDEDEAEDEEDGDPPGEMPGPSTSPNTPALSHGPAPDCSPSSTSITTFPRSEVAPTSTGSASRKGPTITGPSSPKVRRRARPKKRSSAARSGRGEGRRERKPKSTKRSPL